MFQFFLVKCLILNEYRLFPKLVHKKPIFSPPNLIWGGGGDCTFDTKKILLEKIPPSIVKAGFCFFFKKTRIYLQKSSHFSVLEGSVKIGRVGQSVSQIESILKNPALSS